MAISRQAADCNRVIAQGHRGKLYQLAASGCGRIHPATTRPLQDKTTLLSIAEARREAEELLNQFEMVYPNEEVLRTALRGAAAYQLSWFDAHIWAYAECFGLEELVSEDFQHDRMYGTVRAVNPFKNI